VAPHGHTPSQPRASGYYQPWVVRADLIERLANLPGAYPVRAASGNLTDVRFKSARDAILAFVEAASLSGPAERLPKPPADWPAAPSWNVDLKFDLDSLLYSVETYRQAQAHSAVSLHRSFDYALHHLALKIARLPKGKAPEAREPYRGAHPDARYNFRELFGRLLHALPEVKGWLTKVGLCPGDDMCRDIDIIARKAKELV
jgi:hypothetical protein